MTTILECPTQADAPAAPAIDLAALKSRQQATWASGDYAVVGTTLQIVGESLCEAIDLHAGERVLDVAAGNGNATLAAARRFAAVTSTDYVPALLEVSRRRAEADGLAVHYEVADAEALPFPDASFDAVLSTFGVMFTADHPRAAAEMLRVARPGGRIGMTNWTPEGMIGQLFKTIGRRVPPPAGAPSPAFWGTRTGLDVLFGREASAIAVKEREFSFRYRSPRHCLQVFRTWYGPVLKAFAALDAKGQAALEEDVLALLARCNRATDGTLVAPASYLEVIVTKSS